MTVATSAADMDAELTTETNFAALSDQICKPLGFFACSFAKLRSSQRHEFQGIIRFQSGDLSRRSQVC